VGWALAPSQVGQKTGREEVKQVTPTETPYYHHLMKQFTAIDTIILNPGSFSHKV
ncbi:MAG: hypothetical protein EZS28_043575, partial [Streblomastix strix]